MKIKLKFAACWRLAGAILVAVMLHGCTCQCTLKACLDGLNVSYEVNIEDSGIESADLEKISLSWSIDGEQFANVEPFYIHKQSSIVAEFAFHIPELVVSQPESLIIEMLLGGVPLVEARTYQLEWIESVCNECTGGPWCEDLMYEHAYVEISE